MKYFFKQLIFFLAYIFHPNKDSKVVYYHDVGTVYTDMGTDIDLIKKHVDIISQSGFTIVPTIGSRKGEVMICFDDGWAGIYDYKDFFVAQKIKPTVFIAVDLIGKEGYLTKNQIKELKTIGFQFEGHTWSHKDLTSFNREDLEHELKDSKKWLENTFSHSFDSICFPKGRFSHQVLKEAKDVGYVHQFSSISGGFYDLECKGIICRLCAQFSTPREFRWILNSTSTFYRKILIKRQVKGEL